MTDVQKELGPASAAHAIKKKVDALNEASTELTSIANEIERLSKVAESGRNVKNITLQINFDKRTVGASDIQTINFHRNSFGNLDAITRDVIMHIVEQKKRRMLELHEKIKEMARDI